MYKFNSRYRQFSESLSILKDPAYILSNCVKKIESYSTNLFKDYEILSDGSVDIKGFISFWWIKEKTNIDFVKDGRFIKKFNHVLGAFDCSNCGLTTLENGPKFVYGTFSCNKNKLTSLDGCPKLVDGNFKCYGNTTYFDYDDIINKCKVIGEIVNDNNK